MDDVSGGHSADVKLLRLYQEMSLKDLLNAHKTLVECRPLIAKVTGDLNYIALLIGSQTLTGFQWKHDEVTEKRLKQHIANDDGSQPPTYLFKESNSILLDSLTTDMAHQIAATFPTVAQLDVLVYIWPKREDVRDDWHALTHLLQVWGHKLTDFRLFNFTDAATPANFFAVINQMTILKQLTLYTPRRAFPSELTILPQLVKLSFNGDGEDKQLFRALQQYDKSHRGIGQIDCNIGDIKPFFSLSEDLRGRFSDIYVNALSGLKILQETCVLFPNLIHVRLDVIGATVRQVLANLFHLKRLAFLELTIHRLCDIRASRVACAIDIFDTDDTPVAQLKSVKALRLNLEWMRSHEEVARLKINWAVPNLQVIDIQIGHVCTTCDIDLNRAEYDSHITAYCIRQGLLAMLRDCGHLRRIYYNYESRLGTANQLLAE